MIVRVGCPHSVAILFLVAILFPVAFPHLDAKESLTDACWVDWCWVDWYWGDYN